MCEKLNKLKKYTYPIVHSTAACFPVNCSSRSFIPPKITRNLNRSSNLLEYLKLRKMSHLLKISLTHIKTAYVTGVSSQANILKLYQKIQNLQQTTFSYL